MAKGKKVVCRCKVCGRTLRNAESIARGMGPTCERRVIGVVARIGVGKAKSQRDGGEYETIDLLNLGVENESASD